MTVLRTDGLLNIEVWSSYAPNILAHLEVSLLCGAVGLDAAELDGEGLVLAADDDEAPGLAAGPLQVGGDHTLGHPHDQSLLAIPEIGLINPYCKTSLFPCLSVRRSVGWSPDIIF